MTNKEWLFARPNIEIVRTFQGCPPGKTYSRQKCESSDCEECFARWFDADHEEPLKPCPFCGGTTIVGCACVDNNSASASLECKNCGTEFRIVTPCGVNGHRTIAEFWNRRADND